MEQIITEKALIATLSEPLARLWPDFLLGSSADRQANVAAAVQQNRFAIFGANQVGKGHSLRARDQIVFARHKVQNRAGDILEIDDVFTNRHAILNEEILLIEIFDKLTVHFSGHRDVVVQPAFGGKKIFEKFLVVHVLVKVNGLFDEIADGPKEQKGGLKEFRRAIAKSVDKFIHVKILRLAPKI